MSSARDYGVPPPGYRLPEETKLGRVLLQVSDLDRSADYYRSVLGLNDVASDPDLLALAPEGATRPLVELRHVPGSRPVPQDGLLGLFHFAILVPSRADLGRFVRHLGDLDVTFGSADHFVSEAIYLWDPDGLGIEVYADRPRTAWRSRGRELVMTTEPLDLRSLVAEGGAQRWTAMPDGTSMGHVHLNVGDLGRARAFYHSTLGFDAVVWNYPGALFMSVNGYHHHLGTNTWSAARPATAADARLLEWELVFPDRSEISRAASSLERAGYRAEQAGDDRLVADPWGTTLRLHAR